MVYLTLSQSVKTTYYDLSLLKIPIYPAFETGFIVCLSCVSMTEYLSSLFIDPVVRQARRLSESPGILSESIRTWNLLNASPLASIDGNEADQSINATAGSSAWTFATLRNMMPSPPWDVSTIDGEVAEHPGNHIETVYPSIEPHVSQTSFQTRQLPLRTDSETSLNPMNELPDRSRFHDDVNRVHSSSDPTSNQTNQPIDNDAYGREGIQEFEAYNRSREGSRHLPANDGMTQLRRRIQAVQGGHGSAAEKARMVHTLMMEKHSLSQFLPTEPLRTPSPIFHVGANRAITPTSPDLDEGLGQSVTTASSPMQISDGTSLYNLSPADLTCTYAPPKAYDMANGTNLNESEHEEEPHLGCVHYVRNVKLQCHACQKWYTCRFCHDQAEAHALPRRQTRNMLCMLCMTPQKAGQWCRKCGEQAATYYCSVCKLWNNDPEKSVYHCDDCGICRLGQGLGKDFFHCKTCAVCMDIKIESTHRCIERSTKCDCPICGEYMFTSPQSVVFMRCGHSIHDSCLKDWGKTSYKCPICSKSIVNMESQFRNLDHQIEAQPMPSEWRDTKALVYCNDCGAKTAVSYHFLGLKCDVCDSYNTTQLHILNNNPMSPPIVDEPGPQETPGAMTDPGPGILRRRGSAGSETADQTSSSWILSPERAARSVSPVVGNYFGLPRRNTTSMPNADADQDEEPWWRGIESPLQSIGRFWEDRTRSASGNEDGEEGSGSEDSDEDDDGMGMEMDLDDDDDGDEDDNQMDIFGHR